MIRKGTKEDIDRIEEIYNALLLKQDMGEAEIGWIRGVYPTRKTAEEALRAGELFVSENDGIITAAARINREQVPEYKNASWKNKNAPDNRIMVLHTLVVDPAFSGKGYGTEFVKYYEQYALENNCPYLRMDTNAINKPARRLYSHLGYTEADIVPCIFNGIPDVRLVCLEKRLDI
ncbi:MAG: GNAT family N-acetyltransferase [Candidatus Ornithomonoglobus sp.]